MNTVEITLIIVAILILIIGVALLFLLARAKFIEIYNPIKKDNSDYRFIEVENKKTRNIFPG